jgi:23S rRNA pseudouridine2604 synthase
MRLNRYISDAGHCSRREADRLISEGRVKINGKVAVLGQKVMPGDRVTVNGKPVSGGAPKKYLLLYKPRGIVCTADPRERYNIVDYLGYPERVYPVGRLDKDSEGLIIMTSDGDIVNRLLRAAGGHEKEYQVTVDRPVTEDFAKKMSAGVPLAELDRVTLPCQVKKTGKYTFDIVLIQGLNRQIRRMCDYFGYSVTQLKRVRIMNIKIGDMQPGDWRELTKNEMDTLMKTLEEKERMAAESYTDEE